MPTKAARVPRAIVLGCAGERLAADERKLFADADPVGFLLFRRNCKDPDQVRAAITVALDAALPAMIEEISAKVLSALAGTGRSPSKV